MKKQAEEPGPEPQWSGDGQWWWDGTKWTQMWKPPRGLEWDGKTWVRAEEEPAEEEEQPAERDVVLPMPIVPPNAGATRRAPRANRISHEAVVPARDRATPPAPALPAPPAPRASGRRVGYREPRIVSQPHPAEPAAAVRPAPRAAPTPTPPARRTSKRTTLLIAVALVMVMAGIFSVAVTGTLGRLIGDQGASQSGAPRTGPLTPVQIAKALKGRQFTRDVVPPELADSAPLRDVFVLDSAPGLIGQASTTTSDLGATVTFYVFSDPLWAEAFVEKPPTPYGCGRCSSVGDPTDVQGVGKKATSYVVYGKKTKGESWVATTTYVLSGSVVIAGVYYPFNIANPSPSPTDLSLATAYSKAGLQLLRKISA